jgi:Predicted membrane protein
MTTILRTGVARRVGALLLFISPLISWIAELITASAWQSPAYAPLDNWVSNLGVRGPETTFDRVANSPLAWVMNSGWVIYGVLLIAAALLLFRFRGVRPILITVLAVTSGIGVALVGIFHGSQANVDNGLIAFHLGGAQAVIVAGNLMALFVGLFGRRLGLSRGQSAAQLWIGIAGLVGFVVFMIDFASGALWNIGLFERWSIYTIMAAHALLGFTLLTTARSER